MSEIIDLDGERRRRIANLLDSLSAVGEVQNLLAEGAPREEVRAAVLDLLAAIDQTV